MRRLIGNGRSRASRAFGLTAESRPASFQRPLEDLPRAELYHLARERGVPDAVWLTQAQLVEALRGALPAQSDHSGGPPREPVPADIDRLPRAELFHLARARGIPDAVKLSRNGLLAALRPHADAPDTTVDAPDTPPPG